MVIYGKLVLNWLKMQISTTWEQIPVIDENVRIDK